MSGEKPREIALQILLERKSGDFVENLLDSALARSRLSPPDRRLCQELVYGVVRWQAALDWLIDQKTSQRPQKPILRELLRLGLYQIFWLERIPNHAAVNETVASAKQRGFTSQAGFINAVLRGYLREFDTTKKSLTDLRVSRPALGFSHPDWLIARWEKRWGRERTASLLEWNNTPPNTFARVNLLKADPGKLLAQWRAEGIEYDFLHRHPATQAHHETNEPFGVHPLGCSSPDAHESPPDTLKGGHQTVRADDHLDWLPENLVFELKSHPPLSDLRSFQQGLFYIQDPSTLLAVHALDPKPGENILDLCAAPGGKLTYIAQLVQNQARIIAHDIFPDRLKLIEENCARLGVTCVQVKSGSSLGNEAQVSGGGELPEKDQSPVTSAATSSRVAFDIGGQFDRILLDAPCSNTGVMRRRVDLRWRIKPEEITRLRQIQMGLLAKAASLLRPGGTLIYSTCSLEPEENEEVVNEFLKSQPGFKLETCRELLPFKDDVDGAYVATLVRH